MPPFEDRPALIQRLGDALAGPVAKVDSGQIAVGHPQELVAGVPVAVDGGLVAVEEMPRRVAQKDGVGAGV